jgi:hypothetical protein
MRPEWLGFCGEHRGEVKRCCDQTSRADFDAHFAQVALLLLNDSSPLIAAIEIPGDKWHPTMPIEGLSNPQPTSGFRRIAEGRERSLNRRIDGACRVSGRVQCSIMWQSNLDNRHCR